MLNMAPSHVIMLLHVLQFLFIWIMYLNTISDCKKRGGIILLMYINVKVIHLYILCVILIVYTMFVSVSTTSYLIVTKYKGETSNPCFWCQDIVK